MSPTACTTAHSNRLLGIFSSKNHLVRKGVRLTMTPRAISSRTESKIIYPELNLEVCASNNSVLSAVKILFPPQTKTVRHKSLGLESRVLKGG